MNEPSSLVLVRNKAEKELNTISERLEKASAFVNQERAQLDQLVEYENEYLTTIKEHQSGWSGQQIQRYRSFCYQINEAAKNQEKKLEIAEEGLQQFRQQLLEKKHKLSVLDDLIDQQQKQSVVLQDKQQQKQMDELSSIQFRRRITELSNRSNL